MLVLTLKYDEPIWINDDIVISLVRVKGHSIRIGIEAPTKHKILRHKVRERDGQKTDTGQNEK